MAATDAGPVYKGAFGVRDLSAATPMSLDTVFLLASMTKLVTSVAALQLVEQGKLALDGPLGRLIPELGAAMVLDGFSADGSPRLRPASRPLTLRHLLTHTSGFGHEAWSGGIARYQDVTGAPKESSRTNASLRMPLPPRRSPVRRPSGPERHASRPVLPERPCGQARWPCDRPSEAERRSPVAATNLAKSRLKRGASS